MQLQQQHQSNVTFGDGKKQKQNGEAMKRKGLKMLEAAGKRKIRQTGPQSTKRIKISQQGGGSGMYEISFLLKHEPSNDTEFVYT